MPPDSGSREDCSGDGPFNLAPKRISLEATRNLAMVGYTACAKTMTSTVEKNGIPTKMSLDEFIGAFETVGSLDPKDIFDWSVPCSCPDNGVARDDCLR